jgi:polyphenol oxidase
MRLHTHNDLAYYTFDSIAVKHGFFTRHGGASTGMWSSLNLSRSTGDTQEAVVENRKRMMAAMNTTRWLTSWLVHGNHVRVVGSDDLGHDDVHADGMVTRARGMALTLRFADCVPVVFHDRRRDVIGIAHAGWKGIVNGVLAATVHTMRTAFDCDPADIIAGVGPCIGPQKFEVGADVAAEIQGAVREKVVAESAESAEGAESAERSAPPALPAPSAKPYIDLWKAAQSQLYQAGVGEIEVARMCTASSTRDWFSHRAEKGQTGRFGVLIELGE